MRKTLFMFVAFLVATSMYAYDFTFRSGDYLYGATSDSTVEVAQDASYSSLTAVDIPATVERNGKTYTVTTIADEAFRYCSKLAAIAIPTTLVEIGNDAFYGTAWYNNQPTGLVYIDYILYKYKGTMPNGMAVAIKKGTTSISPTAFDGCEGLAGVILPNTLKFIGYAAFRNCASLTEISFPTSLTKIDNFAFDGCRALTSITLPESITRVGYRAFNDCSELTEVITSAKYFEDKVFYGCTKLTSITWNASQYKLYCYNCGFENSAPFYDVRSQIKSFTFGTNVDTIPQGLCYDMGELTDITIPDNVMYIEPNAFQSCSSLKSVTFSKNLECIDSYAFNNCVSLTGVILPESLNTIGHEAFMGCSEIKSITLPKNITYLGYSCFGGTGITSVNWDIKTCKSLNSPFGDENAAITSLVFGDNVENIPTDLGYDLPNIT